jgi:hypothetical protein
MSMKQLPFRVSHVGAHDVEGAHGGQRVFDKIRTGMFSSLLVWHFYVQFDFQSCARPGALWTLT